MNVDYIEEVEDKNNQKKIKQFSISEEFKQIKELFPDMKIIKIEKPN